jgi:hypothetical protein
VTRDGLARRTRWAFVACVSAAAVSVPIVVTGEGAPADASAVVVAGPGPARAAQYAVPAPARRGLAQAAVAAAEGAVGSSTQLAAAVLDRATGELALGARGDEPYYTASLAKVVVAVDVLDRRSLEGLAVTDADLDLLRRALGVSDDDAMNALWSRFDGAGAAGRVAARLGLPGTTGPRDPSQWGEMSVPASDTVRIWQHVLDEMPAGDREFLVSAMRAAPPHARDGFDQAFGLLAVAVAGPDGPGAVAKQGWMCCFSGQYYLHSAGVVGADQRFLVTLLTRQPRGPGWEAARQELDRIAVTAVGALA